ncbi:probable terpene synthase 4 [Euphorbia lathyris]|uniref:probable terpene synthase 4 n=1 Tax=Euphorbia lathyris TaxID=212925 RepID=UPI003314314B
MATLSNPLFPSAKIRRNRNHAFSKIGFTPILQEYTLEKMCNSRSKKLKEAKTLLTKLKKSEHFSSPESLKMVDSLQRLGIDYHFQDDITSILQTHYNHRDQISDLSLASLRFRLLRQEGYYIPADVVFDKFRNKEGKFRRELGADIGGLMGLYEASQLSVGGEEILDEGGVFSAGFLGESVMNLAGDEGRIVADTLKYPYHRSFGRPLVRDLLDSCRKRDDFEEIFRPLALFDFNMIQSFHREEIIQISIWWRDLEISSELQVPRDKPLDWFLWSMACFTDPSFSRKRVEVAKVISLLNLVIDVFDLVGTIDQLSLFAHAVNRWEIEAAEELPDYMKICFKAIYDITNEIAHNMHKELGYNPILSLHKEWRKLCNALLEDARWLAIGKLPKAEDYLKNTILSCGVNLALVHTFFLLNEGVTKESVQIINNNPGIISSVSTILRLWNDSRSAKFGNGDKSYGPYMLCYMKENEGSSVEEARKHVMDKISETWKQLNWECLFPKQFSKSFTKAALNVARLAPFMYQSDNVHTTSQSLHQKDIMKSLVFQRIPA